MVLALFGIFTGYLSLLSLFSTNYCFVGKPAIFVSDSPWKALICYAILTGVIVLAKKFRLGEWLAAHERGLRRAGNVLLFLFLLIFIVSVKVHPQGDQLAVSNGGVGMRKYDFSLFAGGFLPAAVLRQSGGDCLYPGFGISDRVCVRCTCGKPSGFFSHGRTADDWLGNDGVW